MDVKTAFLYGLIQETVYVEQPYEFEEGSNNVCLLDRALYGLKQLPRTWYNTLTSYLNKIGFKPLVADISVFFRGHTFIAVYVNDLLIVRPKKPEIQEIKNQLSERFEMSDLGPCAYYLGMTVRRDRVNRKIFLGQRAYVEKFL
ncbi:unnamed protein product [Zymoseptoria tritici ST99CH_1A5]|uniref:Reverse transcriptase Ty1/copia-type domain-containing protein n=1 Tax=Zymoseptoria tritici ST99CH_1A5 TaxID=1276529 RepID=A0A1Y6M3F4_ZYMTR|nr:unnamed protein product [Zymoseptoria tritici ST99CH_1A5]